jgi:hypothetical protein
MLLNQQHQLIRHFRSQQDVIGQLQFSFSLDTLLTIIVSSADHRASLKYLCFRETLREGRPLRVPTLQERGRVHLVGGGIQVQMCPRIHGSRMQGRQGRVQAQTVRARQVPQHTRQLHVSGRNM